ncbi:hypothetical protein [Roseiflexus sp.]|uniref:hypothetical protein n=1 Tax=Roseiflexus sp. TaxID=2562120 RepID=UPI0021DE6DAF|nr:hypothetical protein [Roseiflexus sp.]GIW03295.1 MAG: hypothetical protein KatS3mg058_4698 [Roseiflexus sp.]
MKRAIDGALSQPWTSRLMPVVRIALAVGVVSLLIGGIWSGLMRMGWVLPTLHGQLALLHGPLFVCGMLGTVIGLERAVALGRGWAFVGPGLTFIGGIAMLIGAPVSLAALLVTGGSLVLLAIFGLIAQRQPARFTVTMALGATVWLGGNLFWLAGRPLALASLWWAGFLILTILGERLELGRLRNLPSQALWWFAAGIGALLSGLILAGIAMDAGMRVAGAGFLALGAWLLQYDVARRTLRRPGLPRFSAVCILSGSGWLIIGGMIALISGALYAGPRYDALLHALFVGFVFAMIFGHAPIIIPALLNLPVRFGVWSYVPLVLLHLSLLMRIGGDLAGLGDVRRWGGMLNATAIMLFLGLTALSVWQGRQTPSRLNRVGSTE